MSKIGFSAISASIQAHHGDADPHTTNENVSSTKSARQYHLELFSLFRPLISLRKWESDRQTGTSLPTLTPNMRSLFQVSGARFPI